VPHVIDQRLKIADWEDDTVMGKRRSVLLTHTVHGNKELMKTQTV
jgi:IS30 family transposase